MLPFLPVEQAKNLGINFDSYPTLSIQSIKSCQFYVLSTTWLKFQLFLSAGTTLTQTLSLASLSHLVFMLPISPLSNQCFTPTIVVIIPQPKCSLVTHSLASSPLMAPHWLQNASLQDRQGPQLTPTFFLPPSPTILPVSYTHLTLPTNVSMCRSRWSPYH